jgi:CRP/FNR family transcriptional regulator, cyclic AMP receptor protein
VTATAHGIVFLGLPFNVAIRENKSMVIPFGRWMRWYVMLNDSLSPKNRLVRRTCDNADMAHVTGNPTGSALLDVLNPADRAAITARLRPRWFRRGQVVFNDGDRGDSLFLVQSGRLDVQLTTSDGHAITVRVVHPGEFFGELALVQADSRRTGRVVALEAVETLALYRTDFEELRSRHPAVDRLLIAALAERVVRMSELTVDLLLPPEERVWRRLALLADAYDPEPIRMSQDDLARASGTVRQTANRVLQRGARAGVLAVERGQIRVLDRNALTGPWPPPVELTEHRYSEPAVSSLISGQ